VSTPDITAIEKEERHHSTAAFKEEKGQSVAAAAEGENSEEGGDEVQDKNCTSLVSFICTGKECN